MGVPSVHALFYVFTHAFGAECGKETQEFQ